MTELSFGVNLGRTPAGAVAAARAAEAAGFDVVTAADHLGSVSPFVMLAAAAGVTERVRLRTYVLDHGFWNPALLARDVATLDALSGGRLEVGLGAGHMRHEHEAARLPFPPYRERLGALEAFVGELRASLADPEHQPAPVQQPVPVFVAAMSAAGLEVAARSGDLVALAGALQLPGRPPGTFRLATSAELDDRVAAVRATRASVGLGAARLDVLLQLVQVDRDPAAAAQEWLGNDEDTTVEELLDSPFVLLAPSPEHAAQELLRRAQRWGITSWCTHTPSGLALAQVVRELRGRDG